MSQLFYYCFRNYGGNQSDCNEDVGMGISLGPYGMLGLASSSSLMAFGSLQNSFSSSDQIVSTFLSKYTMTIQLEFAILCSAYSFDHRHHLDTKRFGIASGDTTPSSSFQHLQPFHTPQDHSDLIQQPLPQSVSRDL